MTTLSDLSSSNVWIPNIAPLTYRNSRQRTVRVPFTEAEGWHGDQRIYHPLIPPSCWTFRDTPRRWRRVWRWWCEASTEPSKTWVVVGSFFESNYECPPKTRFATAVCVLLYVVRTGNWSYRFHASPNKRLGKTRPGQASLDFCFGFRWLGWNLCKQPESSELRRPPQSPDTNPQSICLTVDVQQLCAAVSGTLLNLYREELGKPSELQGGCWVYMYMHHIVL